MSAGESVEMMENRGPGGDDGTIGSVPENRREDGDKAASAPESNAIGDAGENTREKTEVGGKTDTTTTNQLNNVPASRNKDQSDGGNSGMVVKNIESEALNFIMAYESDSSSSSEMELNLRWRGAETESETSSSSDNDEDDDDEEEEDDDEDEDENEDEVDVAEGSDEEDDLSVITAPSQSKGAIKKNVPSKNGGELSLDELPPVPDLTKLNISTENEEFEHMGSVLGVVDKLVTVAAIPEKPAYDLDTLLFLNNGEKPLGFVFDVLGPVSAPIYAVRFNSVEDIKNLQITVGTKVYTAPKNQQHTQYVFLEQLRNKKGCDASWQGDGEVPPEFLEFSDDEEEQRQRRAGRVPSHSKRSHSTALSHASEEHKKFETIMNKRNTLNTRFNNYMDTYRKQARVLRSRAYRKAPHIQDSVPPEFDPTIPPPNVNPYFSSTYMSFLRQNNLPAVGGNSPLLQPQPQQQQQQPPLNIPAFPSAGMSPILRGNSSSSLLSQQLQLLPQQQTPPTPMDFPLQFNTMMDNNNMMHQLQQQQQQQPLSPSSALSFVQGLARSSFFGSPGSNNSITGLSQSQSANYFTNNAAGAQQHHQPPGPSGAPGK